MLAPSLHRRPGRHRHGGEIAALMTGIILAGRTGVAYAAQLGTKQVNEEIDAFRNLRSAVAISGAAALPLATGHAPLLTLYAGISALAAGMLIATTVFESTPSAYFQRSRKP